MRFIPVISPEEKAFRTKFNRALEPIKVMLVNRKKNLTIKDWKEFVELTKSSVISHPDQYLGTELPAHSLMVAIIEGIFEEFMLDETD